MSWRSMKDKWILRRTLEVLESFSVSGAVDEKEVKEELDEENMAKRGAKEVVRVRCERGVGEEIEGEGESDEEKPKSNSATFLSAPRPARASLAEQARANDSSFAEAMS